MERTVEKRVVEPGVRPLASGRWECTFSHKLLHKPKYSYTFNTRAEASEYRRRALALLNAGIVPPGLDDRPRDALRPEPGLADALRGFAQSGVPASTRIMLDRLVSSVGSTRLSQLSPAWAMQFIKEMKAERNLAPATIQKEYGALRAALRHYYMVNNITTPNPLDSVPRAFSRYSQEEAQFAKAAFGEVKHSQPRERRLKPGEEEKILAAIEGKRNAWDEVFFLEDRDSFRALFTFITHTGARLREAYTLPRDAVSLEKNTVKLLCSKVRHGREATRDVPLTEELKDVLIPYLQARRVAPWPTGLLFPFWDGTQEDLKRVSARLSARFSALFKHCGCMDLREHDLRHEATCRWFERRDTRGDRAYAGTEIMRIMGWTDPAMLARYASFDGEDLARRIQGVRRGAAV